MKFIFVDLKGEKNMKKFFVTLMASMLLLSSTTYAVEMSKSHNQAMQMTTMSKSEAIQMLKDAGVEPSKIKMLENGEMAKTEGEFWNIIFYILLATLAANAPTKSGQIFKPNRNGYLFTPSRNPVGQIIYW